MTIRERRRRRKRLRLIKRLATAGLIFSAVGGVTLAIIAATSHQEAAEPPFTHTVEEIPTASPEATTEPTIEPQRGRDLGWSASEEYIAVRMAMAEAEGEDTEGKALVILTVLNRVWSPQFPGTIEEVIAEENAFSSYSNGRYDRVEPDEDCWAALALVQIEHWDESQGALYFERTPEPGESTWHSRNLVTLFIHGNHTFYREEERDGD